MAKKDNGKKSKDKKGSDAADAVEAIRSAVERTFQATTEGGAGKRGRALADEIAHAVARIRTSLDEHKVLDELRGLRTEVENLARRVASLEVLQSKPASSTPARPAATRTRSTASRAKTSAGAKPAAAKSTPSRAKSTSTRAKSTSTRAKSTGTRSRSSS